ncbi:MAG: glycine cleavage system protein GcvH [Bryobacterales bacterium]|jgi:glycine cleavage system H protein|nr:glycine cleavage system protein GcvH [Bryobacterales bacterium]
MYPSNFRYTKDHEWIEAAGAQGTVGITHHAQSELGDIVYVDLPRVGATIAKGDTFGSVESVKAVSDLYSPVTGEVTAVNELLATAPEKLNADPHGEAWLIKVTLTDASEIQDLLSAEEYQTYLEG